MQSPWLSVNEAASHGRPVSTNNDNAQLGGDARLPIAKFATICGRHLTNSAIDENAGDFVILVWLLLQKAANKPRDAIDADF